MKKMMSPFSFVLCVPATAPPAEWYVWERRVQLAAWALGDEEGLHPDLLVSQQDHASAAGFLCRDGPLLEEAGAAGDGHGHA